jgi:hypothetical protein
VGEEELAREVHSVVHLWQEQSLCVVNGQVAQGSCKEKRWNQEQGMSEDINFAGKMASCQEIGRTQLS